jgi:hypothetical protein
MAQAQLRFAGAADGHGDRAGEKQNAALARAVNPPVSLAEGSRVRASG